LSQQRHGQQAKQRGLWVRWQATPHFSTATAPLTPPLAVAYSAETINALVSIGASNDAMVPVKDFVEEQVLYPQDSIAW